MNKNKEQGHQEVFPTHLWSIPDHETVEECSLLWQIVSLVVPYGVLSSVTLNTTNLGEAIIPQSKSSRLKTYIYAKQRRSVLCDKGIGCDSNCFIWSIGSEADFTPVTTTTTFNILIHGIFVALSVQKAVSHHHWQTDLIFQSLTWGREKDLKNGHATFQFMMAVCFELLSDVR